MRLFTLQKRKDGLMQHHFYIETMLDDLLIISHCGYATAKKAERAGLKFISGVQEELLEVECDVSDST